MHNAATRRADGAKAIGRKTIGPKAIVRALEALARRAGAEANDNAHAAYSDQFNGRPSYEEACEADAMETVERAFRDWSLDTEIGRRQWGTVVWPSDLEMALPRLRVAFVDGWHRAEDGR